MVRDRWQDAANGRRGDSDERRKRPSYERCTILYRLVASGGKAIHCGRSRTLGHRNHASLVARRYVPGRRKPREKSLRGREPGLAQTNGDLTHQTAQKQGKNRHAPPHGQLERQLPGRNHWRVKELVCVYRALGIEEFLGGILGDTSITIHRIHSRSVNTTTCDLSSRYL